MSWRLLFTQFLPALKESPILSDPVAVAELAMLILLGNPAVGGIFGPLPEDTLKVHLRNLPLTLGKTAF